MKCITNLQKELSRAQAIPILGPLVSVPKMLVSIVEIFGGVYGGAFFATASLLTFEPWCQEKTVECIFHARDGLIGFFYSILNMNTIGVAAYVIEGDYFSNRKVEVLSLEKR